ncbi:hypothetical protein [Pseudorhodoferax soli]|uniref:hypothetical protein n=1 Tax=Pseudorhodoferax soli TaxID=545864 RepID=UPI0011C04D51|nr:hypothetical protein [Pseudorhodoferax soli]
MSTRTSIAELMIPDFFGFSITTGQPNLGRRIMRSITCALLVTLALSGCSTMKAPTANYSALEADKKASEASTTAKEALDEDFQSALALCDSNMTGLRDSFFGSGRAQITIATVGIIAGSIVVPALAAGAAAKSAIAAWGGVSGAANAAQYTLQQNGVSGSQLGIVYESTRAEIKEATTAYSAAKNNSQRIVAVNELSIACRFPKLPAVEAVKPAT